MKYKHIFIVNEICLTHCSKCEKSFEELFHEALQIEKYNNLNELYGDYVNRVNSCISDDEVAIKRILE